MGSHYPFGHLKHKLWPNESRKNPNYGNFGTPLGSPKTKSHLDVAPWRGAKYTIRGKMMVSLKSKPWRVL